LIFFTISLQSINCQSNTKNLFFADSLFTAKNYTEAYKIYSDILHQDEAYSPAMLLKMAYITEGMGKYDEATLYLSKYYEFNPSPKVISKIKSITEQSELKGYEVSDKAQFYKILTDHQLEITGTLALLLVISLIISIANNKTQRPKYYIPSMTLLLLTFFSNNFLVTPETGVIKESPTLIMDKPTAAGNLIEKVNPGHRVTIESSEDIWYQIKWKGEKAYLKKKSVSRL